MLECVLKPLHSYAKTCVWDMCVALPLCLSWWESISRLLKITGLFCRISSLSYGSFAKETYHFKEPTNRSCCLRVSHVKKVQANASCHTCSRARVMSHARIYTHSCVCGCACANIHTHMPTLSIHTTISRLLKMIGLFCKRAVWKRRYPAECMLAFVCECVGGVWVVCVCARARARACM